MTAEYHSFAIGTHGVLQHAVYTVLDGEFLIPRLDVNIARAPLKRVKYRGVYQLDDGRNVALIRGEPVDRKSSRRRSLRHPPRRA